MAKDRDPPNPLIGRNAIYVGHTDRPFKDLRDAFERVEGESVFVFRKSNGISMKVCEQRAVELDIVRDGFPVRTFRYFRCYGFKGMPRSDAKSTY